VRGWSGVRSLGGSTIVSRVRFLLIVVLASVAASRAREVERVRVAVVAGRGADWRVQGLTRAVGAQLCGAERVFPANHRSAERLAVALTSATDAEVAKAARLLRAQFAVVVASPERGAAWADVVAVSPLRRVRVEAKGNDHELPDALAAAIAGKMGVELSEIEREAMGRPVVANEAAIQAMWRGDAAVGPREQARCCRAALHHDASAALLHNQLGAALARAGKADEALAAFARALELRPRYAAAHTNRGLVLKGQKRWREAEEAFRAAIGLGAKSATPHIGLARLLDRVGATIEAVEEIERAVEIDPSHVGALTTLADYYFECYDLRAARRTANRVLELEPDNVRALNLVGLLLLVPHDYKEAEATLQKALAARPGDPETLANLALAIYGQRRAKEAIAMAEKALAVDPRCAKAHLYLGRIYLAEGEPERAVEAFEKAAEIKPDMVAARRGLSTARSRIGHSSKPGCGCLPNWSRGSSLAQQAPGMALPAVVLLAPHVARLMLRRRRRRR